MTETIKTLLQPIQNRLNAATKLGGWEVRGKDVVIYDPNGYGAHRIVAWVDHPEYTEPIAAAPADQARLLAAVQAVLVVCEDLDDVAKIRSAIPGTKSFQSNRIRAAIESALTEAR